MNNTRKPKVGEIWRCTSDTVWVADWKVLDKGIELVRIISGNPGRPVGWVNPDYTITMMNNLNAWTYPKEQRFKELMQLYEQYKKG